MKSLHCLPIRAKSMEEFEARLKTEAPYADLIEIWLDSIKNLRLAEIFFAIDKIKIPFLFVNKNYGQGGEFMGEPEEQINVLKEVFERGAEFVDVDVDTAPSLIKILLKAKGKGKLILSYHNFKTTPSFIQLKRIVKVALKRGADIVKIATYLHENDQNVEPFKLTTWAHEEGIKIITVGMGEKGHLSRVVCPILGSAVYYAPLKVGDETAPGQIPKADLERIWKMIKA